MMKSVEWTIGYNSLEDGRILVVSMYDDHYSRMADITIHGNFSGYCSLHDYDLRGEKIDESFLEGRPAQWGKIKLLRKLLDEVENPWIFFIDCDCLFMNFGKKLEDLIPVGDEFVVMPKGGGSPDNGIGGGYRDNNIMSSHILIKNCEKSKQFLQEIWEAPDWPEGMGLGEFDHEMRQIRLSYRKDHWRNGIKLVEEKKLNRFWYPKNPYIIHSFPHMVENLWQPGDFIVHVTSYARDERVEILKLLSGFAGGLIGQWHKDTIESGRRITFSPLANIEAVTIRYKDKEGNPLHTFDFKSLSRSGYYYFDMGEVPDDGYVEAKSPKGEVLSIYKF